jgi:hypothetical protein
MTISANSPPINARGDPAADAAALKAGPSDEQVRVRFLTGHWPTAAEVAELQRRHRADPRLAGQPLCEVVHELLGVPDRRAGQRGGG